MIIVDDENEAVWRKKLDAAIKRWKPCYYRPSPDVPFSHICYFKGSMKKACEGMRTRLLRDRTIWAGRVTADHPLSEAKVCDKVIKLTKKVRAQWPQELCAG